MSNPVAAAPSLGHDGATPRAAIRAALDLIVEPNAVVELRVPHSRRGTLSGYFDDVDALVNIAADLSGRVEGVYVTLNPVDRALLARAVNRVSEYAKHTTADNNIVRRRWMLVDFDPVRPSGISSTDEEHQRGRVRRATGCASRGGTASSSPTLGMVPTCSRVSICRTMLRALRL